MVEIPFSRISRVFRRNPHRPSEDLLHELVKKIHGKEEDLARISGYFDQINQILNSYTRIA